MKPEYEKYRGPDMTRLASPSSVRIPEELVRAGELFARLEGDSFTGLIIEGLARVVEDRMGDPAYMAERMAEFTGQLDVLREALGIPPSNPA